MLCVICITNHTNTITARISVGEATIGPLVVCHDCTTTNLDPILTNL